MKRVPVSDAFPFSRDSSAVTIQLLWPQPSLSLAVIDCPTDRQPVQPVQPGSGGTRCPRDLYLFRFENDVSAGLANQAIACDLS